VNSGPGLVDCASMAARRCGRTKSESDRLLLCFEISSARISGLIGVSGFFVDGLDLEWIPSFRSVSVRFSTRRCFGFFLQSSVLDNSCFSSLNSSSRRLHLTSMCDWMKPICLAVASGFGGSLERSLMLESYRVVMLVFRSEFCTWSALGLRMSASIEFILVAGVVASSFCSSSLFFGPHVPIVPTIWVCELRQGRVPDSLKMLLIKLNSAKCNLQIALVARTTVVGKLQSLQGVGRQNPVNFVYIKTEGAGRPRWPDALSVSRAPLARRPPCPKTVVL